MSAWWHRFIPGRKTAPEPEGTQEVESCTEEQKPRQLRRVTIGLDFGTSTSKCCFREEADRKPLMVVGYEPDSTTASQVLLPTSVTLEVGVLLFGHEAENSSSPSIIRSFKMCLLCQARAAASLRPTHTNPCPNCRPDRPGYFRLGPKELSAEDLSILYIAVVLGVAKQRVCSALGMKPDAVRFVVNSAAPLDQMTEFGEVGEYFENALYYAWSLADVSRQPWPVDEAMTALEQIRKTRRPGIEESRTRIFPETHAAMTAYLLLPESEMGLYGLVDIGAGTTDVAFFWLQKGDAGTTAWYYSAGSKRVGMDDIDYALAETLGVPPPDARAAREVLSEKVICSHGCIIKPIADTIYRHQTTVLEQAMNVDQRPRAWFNDGLAMYKLFLVGGGSICTPVTERIEREPPRHRTRWKDPPTFLTIPGRTRVTLPSGDIVPLRSLQEPHSARLLLLACGLAFRRPDIPKYERDSEGVHVEVKKREIPDEFSGHWW